MNIKKIMMEQIQSNQYVCFILKTDEILSKTTVHLNFIKSSKFTII